jgi:hypothetical protein
MQEMMLLPTKVSHLMEGCDSRTFVCLNESTCCDKAKLINLIPCKTTNTHKTLTLEYQHIITTNATIGTTIDQSFVNAADRVFTDIVVKHRQICGVLFITSRQNVAFVKVLIGGVANLDRVR